MSRRIAETERGSRIMSMTEPLFSSEGGDRNMSETAMQEEKWLFLDVGERESKKLLENKIPVVMASIRSPFNAFGCAFPSAFLNDVLALLNLSDAELIETGTDVRNVYMLHSRQQVRLESRDHIHPEAWTQVKKVLMRYASKLNVAFTVSCPHGRNSPETAEEGNVHVRFWSIPSNYTRTRVTIGSVFGVGLSSAQRDGFAPTNAGIPIADDEGTVIAEVFGTTIYVLCDLVHEPENVDVIMDAILERYAHILEFSPEEIEKHFEDLKKKEHLRVKRAYVRACSRRRESRISQCQSNLRSTEQEINNLQRAIAGHVERLQGFRRELELLKHMDDDTNYGAEYDKLLEVPQVEDVQVSDKVSVTTSEIAITHRGKTYPMGRFRIDFLLNDRFGVVRCYNLDRSFDGGEYYHPHIRGSGECCFGNMAEGIGQLVGEFQFSIATQMIIQFLNSYNPDDAYRAIEELRG